MFWEHAALCHSPLSWVEAEIEAEVPTEESWHMSGGRFSKGFMRPGRGSLKHHLRSPMTDGFSLFLCCHFPGGSDGKAFVYNAGDLGSIPGLGRSTGEGNGNPLQYYCLENPMEEEPGRLQSMGSQGVGHN